MSVTVEPATPEPITISVEPEDFLLYYSEWLDLQHLLATPGESGDERSHEELVRDFLDSEALASHLLG